MTLKYGLEVTQGHSSLHPISYSPSIVTMAPSCIICEIKRDFGRKLWFFHTPLHSAPPLGGPRPNIATPFGMETLEWRGYLKKNSRISITVYTQYRRVTDGRTDRQTDILRRHSPRYAYASRGKNGTRYSYSYNSRLVESRIVYWMPSFSMTLDDS